MTDAQSADIKQVEEHIRKAAGKPPEGEEWDAVEEVRALREGRDPGRRQSVSLTPEAAASGEWLLGHTDARSMNDAICRALRISEMIQKQIIDGSGLYTKEDGQLVKIIII